MIILGIDPGILRTGYSLLQTDDFGKSLELLEMGVIKTLPKDPIAIRLQMIYQGVTELIAIFKPNEFAIETVFVGKNIQSALKLGQARGAAIVAAGNERLPVFEYAPREIKKSITGRGTASKEQVQFMVKNILRLDKLPTPNDAADATAIAIAHIQHLKYSRRLNNAMNMNANKK